MLLLGVGVLGAGPRMALAVEPVIALAPPGEPAEAFPRPTARSPRSSVRSGRPRMSGAPPTRPGRSSVCWASSRACGWRCWGREWILHDAVGACGGTARRSVCPGHHAGLSGCTEKTCAECQVDQRQGGTREEHDPRLPARTLDAAVLIHMYHEIAQPFALLFNLAASMNPKSLVGIVDLDRPTDEHGTPPICFVANSRRWVIGKLASTSSGAALDILRSSNRRCSGRRLRRSRLAGRQSDDPVS